MHLVAGTQLKNGQYLLNHVFDQQGIGWTYRATQMQLQQNVLIKTLNPTLRSHPQFTQICQDFILRSRELGRLRHPSLVRVLDIFTDQDMPFVVLEYLQGISLNDWMNDRKRGEAEVIQLLRQMSHVLTYLQQHNLPHANLKPRNILYTSDSNQPEKNRLVLVGFAPSLRLSEMIATRNPYSAPELRHGKVTPSSDLYSLSGLLYYCLTQHPPVETETETDDLRSVVDHRFPLLSLLKPGAQRLLRSGSAFNSTDRPTTPELWLSQLSKSRPAAKSIPPQAPIETKIQAPIPDRSLDVSQKPTYLQDPTLLRDSGSFSDRPQRPNTQVQPPTTKIQDPASDIPQPHPAQSPIQPISLPENLPRYRTTPVTAFAEPSEARRSPAPARYIPDESHHDRNFVARDSSNHRKSMGRSKYLPHPRVLKLTLLFATLAGLTFGIILRFQASQRPGSSFFHTGQSFPPREWKGTLTPDAEVTKDVFIEPGTPSPTAPAARFPDRAKTFDPDDVLIPEATPSVYPDAPEPRKPKKSL